MAQTHLIIILLIYFISIHSMQFQDLSAKFKSIQSKNLTEMIEWPLILEELSLSEELDEFNSMQNNSLYTNFTGNPDQNVNLILKEGQKESQRQSFFVVGHQFSKLRMEVTVHHQGDPYNHDKEMVKLFLLNRNTNQVIFSKNVKHFRFFVIDIDSDLYEIVIQCHFLANQEAQHQNASNKDSLQDFQIFKYVSIKMDILDNGVSRQNKEEVLLDVIKQLTKIREETDRIFLDSLSIWDGIHSHQKSHEQHAEEVLYRAYFEIVALLGIYLVQYFILQKYIKVKVIV